MEENKTKLIYKGQIPEDINLRIISEIENRKYPSIISIKGSVFNTVKIFYNKDELLKYFYCPDKDYFEVLSDLVHTMRIRK